MKKLVFPLVIALCVLPLAGYGESPIQQAPYGARSRLNPFEGWTIAANGRHPTAPRKTLRAERPVFRDRTFRGETCGKIVEIAVFFLNAPLVRLFEARGRPLRRGCRPRTRSPPPRSAG